MNEDPIEQIVKELDIIQDELFEIAKSKHNNMITNSDNYKELCETWYAPRIFRLPNSGAGDSYIDMVRFNAEAIASALVE